MSCGGEAGGGGAEEGDGDEEHEDAKIHLNHGMFEIPELALSWGPGIEASAEHDDHEEEHEAGVACGGCGSACGAGVGIAEMG